MVSKLADFLRDVKEAMEAWLDRFTANQPVLRRGEVYSQEQVLRKLKVHLSTVQKWELLGLRACQPGTKAKFFLSDELIDFLAAHREVPE